MSSIASDPDASRSHADAIIAAINTAASAAGFQNAVVSSADEVMATIAAPSTVNINIPVPVPVPEPPAPAPPCASRLSCSELNALYGGAWGNPGGRGSDQVCGESDNGFGGLGGSDSGGLGSRVCMGGEVGGGADVNHDGWQHANNICQAIGSRLCTIAELQAEETRGSGCQHDLEFVWSSEPCDGGHSTALGGNHCAGDGCSMESGCDECAGQAECVCDQRCADDDANMAVRCCADVDVLAAPQCPTAGYSLGCSAKTCTELNALYGGWPLDNSCTPTDDVLVCAESDNGLGQFSADASRDNACQGGQNSAQGADEVTDGWAHAATICQSVGARLCSVAELQADEARCTGCQHDAEQVWSSEACNAGHLTAQGGSHRGNEACPDECSVSACLCTPQCWEDDISHAVRCCADETPPCFESPDPPPTPPAPAPSDLQNVAAGLPSGDCAFDACVADGTCDVDTAHMCGGWCAGTNGIRRCGAASSSTVGWGGEPDRGIDGNTNSAYGGNSCTHTDDPGSGEPNNAGTHWWQLDLGTDYAVDSVNIYHRTDCCVDRLLSATVVVSDTADYTTTGTNCGAVDDHLGQPDVTDCSGAVGRYVTVERMNMVITICELEVMAPASATPPGTEVRACESQTLDIDCAGEGAGLINIQEASYGRQHGPDVCPHSATSNQDCHEVTSLSVVAGFCQGQESCSVGALNSIFGDPCQGTFKYLTVLYDCGTEGTPPPPPAGGAANCIPETCHNDGHWVEVAFPEVTALDGCISECLLHPEATALQFNDDGWCGCMVMEEGVAFDDAIESGEHIGPWGHCTVCDLSALCHYETCHNDGHWVEVAFPDAGNQADCRDQCINTGEATAFQYNDDGWCGCMVLDGVTFEQAVGDGTHLGPWTECTICDISNANLPDVGGGGATSAEITAAVDNAGDIWCNGNLLGTVGSWSNAQTWTCDAIDGNFVIGIDGRDAELGNNQGVGALIATIRTDTGSTFSTDDSGWRCWNAPAHGSSPPDSWMTTNFDDSNWPIASSFGQNADGPATIWRNVRGSPVPDIADDAHWIWSPDNNNHNDVFCRGVIVTGGSGAQNMPQAYYQFAGNADDLTGTNHGAISGATFVADRFGQDNNALRFDGNDYVTIVSPFPAEDTHFTLALWLSTEITNDGNWHAFIGYQNGGVCPGRSPSMWVARFEGLHWDSCQSGTRYAGVLNDYFPVAEVNTYQHVVWTKIGTDYTFYKNGEQFDSVQPAAQNVQLSDNYWIGHVDNYFTGTIDEVGIYDYGLSAEDVAALYDATSVLVRSRP